LVEVWTMIAAVATRDVNHLCIRLLSTVVAAIDMKTGAIEMGKGRRQPKALCRRGGNETVECRDPVVIEQSKGRPSVSS
jgi:hypothetical protein